MSFFGTAQRLGLTMRALFTAYDGVKPTLRHAIAIDARTGSSGTLNFAGAEWQYAVASASLATPDRADALDIIATFEVTAGLAEAVSVSLELLCEGWSTANYVLMPGVAYNGNRFETRDVPYPPVLLDAGDIGADKPTVITAVAPHLSIGEGPSRIQQTTGDPSTPAMAFRSEATGLGCIVLTEQLTTLGPTGLEISESDDRASCAVRLTAPAVREAEQKHDEPASFGVGSEVTLRARVFAFDCPTIQALFNRFGEVRKDLTGPVALVNSIPFSHAWAIQEAKFNRDNWSEPRGYYKVGTTDGRYDDWQVGWVGGAMTTFPLTFAGSPLSRERSARNLDFLFTSQTECGLMHGIRHDGKWYGDGFGYPHAERWHLIRKSADALYFLLKHFILMRKQDANWSPPQAWAQGTRRLADAFVTMWRRYGQFGQFVDVYTGEIIVGGSTSGSTAPAGLALAGEYFGVPEYVEVAEASALSYYESDVMAGVTTGGPGEILQNPDSESASNLLESFVVLYEVTGKREWLGRGLDMARQCATWTVSYDYEFPATSEFGRLGIKTAGSVIANAQNKHSAPGFCTLSGDSLFKLYRYTGDALCLELVHETAHNMPQYLSRDDRPVRDWDGRDMPPGWMCERVNMSDWEGKDHIGGVFRGSCWCETTNMLAYVEVPGLYVQPDTGFVCAFDHIDVEVTAHDGASVSLRVTNPTPYDAEVRLMVEPSTDTARILGQAGLWGCPTLSLAAGETKDIVLGTTIGGFHS